MALQLQHDLKKGDVLLSLGELGRVLNMPESRIEKAVASGAIQPLGIIGRNTVVAMSSREFIALDEATKRFQASFSEMGDMPTRAPIPEMPAPKPAVIPGTFTA